MPRIYSNLEKVIKYKFQNQDIIVGALTHPSAVSYKKHKNSSFYHFERLEFLGDRILGFVVSNLLYQLYPDQSEGFLAKQFAYLVSKDTIAEVALKIKLGNHIQSSSIKDMGAGVLADTCEAVIAAIYLDGGIIPVTKFIEHFWQSFFKNQVYNDKDPKTYLQEWSQELGYGKPLYTLVSQSGSPHSPLFIVSVELPGAPFDINKQKFIAQAKSKKEAEKLSAKLLIKTLNI